MPLKLVDQVKEPTISAHKFFLQTYDIISWPGKAHVYYEPYGICAFLKDGTFLRVGKGTGRGSVCHPISYSVAPIIPAPSEESLLIKLGSHFLLKDYQLDRSLNLKLYCCERAHRAELAVAM